MDDKLFNDKVSEVIKNYLKSTGFTARKLTDSPTDDLQVVSRKYVNLNGTVAARPTGAKTGQSYFATDTSIPMKFNGTNWVNGVGSVVALG